MGDWYWDERSGRRVPTSRRARLNELARSVPSGVVLWAVAIAIWIWGVVEFVTGKYYIGGALVFAGGLLLFVWAGGGWRLFRSALANWLGGPG